MTRLERVSEAFYAGMTGRFGSSARYPFGALCRSAVSDPASGQVGPARVGDRGVREHVHERRLFGLEGALQRGLQLAGLADQLAVAAERLDDLVVAQLRLQLRGHRIAVEELHRVLLERPDAVVAHDADDR